MNELYSAFFVCERTPFGVKLRFMAGGDGK